MGVVSRNDDCWKYNEENIECYGEMKVSIYIWKCYYIDCFVGMKYIF